MGIIVTQCKAAYIVPFNKKGVSATLYTFSYPRGLYMHLLPLVAHRRSII